MNEKAEDIDNLATVIIAMQTYGNQRFNAALSEAIDRIDHDPSLTDHFERIKSILEGLKIKP